MSEVLSFETIPLLTGLAGGAFITSAISFMNTTNSTMTNKIIGMVMFSIGWASIIASFDKNGTREDECKNQLIISSVAIWANAMILRMLMDSKAGPGAIIPFGLMFMSAWFVIGYSVSKKIEFTDEEADEVEKEVVLDEATGQEVEVEVEPVVNKDVESKRMILSATGILVPITVFASMFVVNKLERTRGIVSGIGLPTFMAAFVGLAMTNSFILQS